MRTTNYTFKPTLLQYLLFSLAMLCSTFAFSQEDAEESDTTKTGYALGNIKMPNPNSIVSKYTYDPLTDRYIYTEKVGDFNINYPIILTPAEYQRLVIQEQLRNYYKQKIDAAEGKKEGTEEEQKNLLPEFYVDSGFFETIFGGNTIEVVPQGSVEMDLGVLFTKQDNPSFSPRNRSNFTFDFDQRISLSLLGKVGTRLQVTANYDTESTFDFQNLIKLEYTPTEDDIVRKIEVGNVSMPLNSSLITGAQSLFGVKTELQFGKTRVTAVFSEQKSQSQSVVAQGGGTLEEFSFFARDYDENRHFFLSQYFRETYDASMMRYPYINNNIQITRIEVWVTNRSNQTDNVRNIAAFQDLGESEIVGSGVNILNPGALPDNSNNGFDPTNIGGAGSNLNDLVRDITTVEQGINIPANEGFDFGKLENARKLEEGYDYTLNTQLGYISLNQRLLNDEVLAVAFQYTVGGQVYQVGEFANDGVEATGVTTDTGSGNQVVSNNSLVLKMLKSAITSVEEPIWDLMMKNVYDTGAFQLSQEDFKLNIFYTEASPVNYILPVEGTAFPLYDNNTTDPTDDSVINETPLIRLFHLDRLNYNNDPQLHGDGFFDFVEGQTVLMQNGKIIFTKVEPFGKYLFDVLDDPSNPGDYDADIYTNANQEKYVYDILYKKTKTAALDEIEKNKFQIKGSYKSSGGDGIPLGAFNVPRGSVVVTAGGRTLVEGIDYTVNYQLGRVQILDEALKASNTPINVSVENNAVFGQQTRRFAGVNVEHQFNENFVLGATFLNLSERPITQKANYNTEPINNTIFGFNGNYSTEVPFFTRLVNKLPNIDTDVPSNLSVRGEFAYLAPGAPKGTDFNNEATAYVDDFEGTQGAIDLLSPQSWFLSSRPRTVNGAAENDPINAPGLENGFDRAFLNWYTIDPIFYSSQRPSGISDDDVSNLYSRRVFIDEVFPQVDIVQGQSTIINTLDLRYYPTERGPYNFDPSTSDGTIDNPTQAWAGITRQITSTDFEQANVEYIEFWVQDPFLDNENSTGGKLYFNLGNISEDILKDGKKQYENGLPENGDVSALLNSGTDWAVPQNQSLIYTFSTLGQERTNQDVGYDGFDDAEEAQQFPAFAGLEDPSNDNYTYFLNTSGDIFERYKKYNGTQGNSPETFTETNRGSTTQPDVEDINRDNTMNTIDSYYEYEIDITPASLVATNEQINDIKTRDVVLPNGDTREVKWYQFRIPISEPTSAVGGITDIRSVRFARMYLNGFNETTTLRFATLDLVRSDWRRYTLDLDNDSNNNSANPEFSVGIVGLQENEGNYVLPPGVELEQLNNNNNIIRQNEQSLVLNICNLEPTDSKGVFKNINVDMRQYKKLRMFMHAQDGESGTLDDEELVGFIRMGNDLTQNFYQIEVPLKVSTGSVSATDVWPEENEINIQLSVLQEIKSRGISAQTLSNLDPTFYDVINGELSVDPVTEFSPHTLGQQRVAIKGNPNFGDIRVLMVGVKNINPNEDVCGEVWVNELRLSDLENEGGWAAIASVDTNFADFANISATGRQSTSGFGSVEQRPNERSREDVQQYDVVTNVQLGQLLPKKWGIQIPFNYAQSEELITPKYDQYYNDLTLESRIDAAETEEEREQIRVQSENYTKRKSINFIGVKKQRSTEAKPHFYDVENLTFNYSYNKVEHRDFEIERSLDQNIRAGVNYNYSFTPKPIEPFKKNDSLFRGKYWKILKDFNFNVLPTTFSVNTDIIRQFNKQKFRDVELGGDNIGIEELFRRNYTFNFQYAINYNITNGLNLNFSAANKNIVRNYFIDDQINGSQDPTLDVWDGFFDLGDPNIQAQDLQINYDIPLYKIPTFSFLKATYSYTANFQWQKGSDLNTDFEYTDDNDVTRTYNLGNSVQNANTHSINSTLNMENLYRYVGLVKKPTRTRARTRATPAAIGKDGKPAQNQRNNSSTSKAGAGTKILNAGIDLLTSIKRIQINYTENNGTFLPGYLRTPGFVGTLKPTFGYTFGSQRDIRDVVARNGWLTVFPEFNQQYMATTNKILDLAANMEPINDLKIDFTGSRTYSESMTENFRVEDLDNDGELDYNSLIQNSYGNFNISTALIKTAFSKSDENQSEAFDNFRENRLVIANRLARNFYGNSTYDVDDEGYPLGFGKNSQAVLLPAFLSAYQGTNPDNIKLGAFRDVPIPNWQLKYTGFMKFNWFKKRFKRFSVTHGYRSSYTINQFRTNLDYQAADPTMDYTNQDPNVLDQSGNFKNRTVFSNINLEEQFSPLVRVDFEMKNSIKILAEIKKDRVLSLSFDNNLLTEIQGKEYIIGLGYRIKDVRIRSKLAGPKQIIKSDLNMSADISIRDNKTIIRYLDLDNNQITSGQTILGFKYNADYAFSKNLTGIFYFDYTFSEYAISTAFPQTTIRSGITLRYNFGN
ncbi:cell surface protein SprA [Meridianimaribacter flavus]|uniref:Protein involved in gliding motility SprA n=1 Tax=Meridianimaribacter flavus TaxID=571115 RepID=A0ABY2G308_9FLAO|nr:protein involved in gliding motility SprA [Meridianimaribacter flavus]